MFKWFWNVFSHKKIFVSRYHSRINFLAGTLQRKNLLWKWTSSYIWTRYVEKAVCAWFGKRCLFFMDSFAIFFCVDFAFSKKRLQTKMLETIFIVISRKQENILFYWPRMQRLLAFRIVFTDSVETPRSRKT